jgi:hypothetical protein
MVVLKFYRGLQEVRGQELIDYSFAGRGTCAKPGTKLMHVKPVAINADVPLPEKYRRADGKKNRGRNREKPRTK